jgi:tetratricopeptide (TPR) repeat protein
MLFSVKSVESVFFYNFAAMKTHQCILVCLLAVMLCACDATTREARRMVKRAERLADTLPDSTVRLIDSVLRMPASFSERERMDMALLQAEALFGDRGQEISPVMDDDFFDEHANLSTSPELERAAAYYTGKKQYANAAHAALYSGFVQQHYNEKESAMRSFKEAEQYGKLAVDSLTVAQAEYWMGKMLCSDGMEQEALAPLLISEDFIGNRYAEKASIENSMAVVYILMGQHNNARICLNEGLAWADKAHFEKVRRKILNNYAVLYRLQGRYDDAIAYHRQMIGKSNLDETETFAYYLNVGKTFTEANEMDSATSYFKQVEALLHNTQIKMESRISACGALSQFAERQGNIQKALQYKVQREELMSKLLVQRQEQNTYRIQRQYDYESLQNIMNQKITRTQRIIAIGIVLFLCFVTLFLFRSAQRSKREAEVNANLFHFMQQNKELIESNMAQERKVLDTTQQLSDMYYARFKTMQKLSFSIENPKNKIALKDLEKVVFGDGEHWEAVKEVIDALYPGLRESVTYKYPEMDEMERRVFILSRFKLSRMEKAALLGISTSVLDKLRTRVHKIVEKDKKQ